MKLLIATHSYLAVAAVEPDPWRVEHLKIIDSGYFYGADQLEDGRILAAERWDSYTKRSPTIFRLYSEGGEPLQEWQDEEIVDVHQLTDTERGVCVCDTGHNRIVKMGPAGEHVDDLSFGPTDHDVVHVNSIDKTGQFAVLHNLGFKPSHLVDLASKRRYETDHLSIHNVESDPYRVKTLFYNASDDGRVCWFHLDVGLCREIIVGGHPKGMAVTDDWIFVGVSEHAVKRERRFVSDGKIAVISRQAFELREMLNLRHEDAPLGNVNEIRRLRSPVD